MQNKCNTKIGFNNKVLSLRKIHFQSLTSLFLHFPNYKLAKQGKTLLHIFPYPLFFHLYTYFLFHKETEDDNISHCEENTLELDWKVVLCNCDIRNPPQYNVFFNDDFFTTLYKALGIFSHFLIVLCRRSAATSTKVYFELCFPQFTFVVILIFEKSAVGIYLTCEDSQGWQFIAKVPS